MRFAIVLLGLVLAFAACGGQRETGPIERAFGELSEADVTHFEHIDRAIGDFDQARGAVVGAAPTGRTAAELAAAVREAEASHLELENAALAAAVEPVLAAMRHEATAARSWAERPRSRRAFVRYVRASELTNGADAHFRGIVEN